MVTLGQVIARLDECGYDFKSKSRDVVVAAIARGDVLIIVERKGQEPIIRSYAKHNCKPLSDSFPEAFPQ